MRVHRYSRRVETSRRMARLLNPFASLLAAPPQTAQQRNALLAGGDARATAGRHKASGRSAAAYAADAATPDTPPDPNTDPNAPVGTDPDYPDDPQDPWGGDGNPGEPWSDPGSPWNDPSGPGYDPGPIGGPLPGHNPGLPPSIPVYGDPNEPQSPHPPMGHGHWRIEDGPVAGFPGAQVVYIWGPPPPPPATLVGYGPGGGTGGSGTGGTGGGTGGGGTGGGGTGGGGTGGGGTGGGGTGGGGTGGGGSTSGFSFYVEWPYDVANVYLLADVQSGPVAGVSTIYVVPDDPSDLYTTNYAIDIYNPAGKLARHLTSFDNTGDAFAQMWSTAEHGECNGTYRVVVTKTLAGGGSIRHESTFDVKNLVVTSTSVGGAGGASFGGTGGGAGGADTSGVLRYDPDSASPLTINVKVDAAYKAETVLAWATLYSADHKIVTQTFVQTLNSVCGSGGTATFSLDARQMTSAPGSLAPDVIPKGIYFYCVHTCSTSYPGFISANGVDYDDDKTVAPVQWIADVKMKPTGDDGTNATYDVLYKVTGSEKPQDARLDYYDSDLKLQHSWPVHPDTDPLDPDTGDHKISLQVPSDMPGTLAFQSHTGPSLDNKNYGPQRPALPRGSINAFSYCIGFYHHIYTQGGFDETELFKDNLQHFSKTGANYHAVPHDDDLPTPSWYYEGDNVSVKKMIAALRHAKSGSKQAALASLKVVVFGGHANDNGGLIHLNGDNRADTQTTKILVPSTAYHNDPKHQMYFHADDHGYDAPGTGVACQPYSALEMDPMLQPSSSGPQNVLADLDLAILIGCTVGMPGPSPLANEFKALGAKCVLRIGNTKSNQACEYKFVKYFFDYCRLGSSISDAAQLAKNEAMLDIGRIEFDAQQNNLASGYWPFLLDYAVEGNGNNPLKP